MLENLAFERAALAKAYCDSLEGKGITNAASGLFLAGPRRVGKSTFLTQDLIPQASARDWISIYIDLWSDQQADPALLIIEAIKATLAEHASKLSRLTSKVQVKKIKLLGSIELDFSAAGLPDNITLVQLLEHLAQLTKKTILLVIDEAQHALISENGLNAMFAIKSARDQINKRDRAPDLMLVFTGSNRDKLAQLVIKKDQPFFGSSITSFPLLGRDYTDFFTSQINQGLASGNQFNNDDIWEAFHLVGHRPEILRQIVGRVAISNEAESFSDLLKQDAFVWHGQIWQEYENDFNFLSAQQQAVLALLIQQGRAWSPFSEKSMSFYKERLGTIVKAPAIQTAIQALRDKGFIWQSSRGTYALEDEGFAEWFRHKYGETT